LKESENRPMARSSLKHEIGKLLPHCHICCGWRVLGEGLPAKHGFFAVTVDGHQTFLGRTREESLKRAQELGIFWGKPE